MDESDPVCGFHGHCDLLDDVDGTSRRQRSASKNRLQIASVDQTHVDEESPIDFAIVVNGDDVWLAQTRRGVGFAAKALLKNGVGGPVGEAAP